MNRRAVLGGFAMLAGAAASGRGRRDDTESVGTRGGPATAALAGRAKLRVGFVGLCAFVRDSTGKYYKAGLIDPTKVTDPERVNFKKHYSTILIDSRYVSGGTDVSGSDLKELRLNTTLTSFQMWPLDGYNVDIPGLPVSETHPSLTGVIPINKVYPGTIVDKWEEQKWVQSAIPIMGGLLFSGPARIDSKKVYTCFWKLTGTQAISGLEWGAIADLPRPLSDVVEYHSSVPENTTITLIERKAQSPMKIQISTTATTELEIWILNMPKKDDHTDYEMKHPHELQHARGFYQLFQVPPGQLKVPITDPTTYPTADPIFCPPAEVQ